MGLVEKTIWPAVKFVLSTKIGERVAIVHGHDCDSVTSAAILFKTYRKLTGKDPAAIASSSNNELTSDILQRLKNYDVIVVPDIPVIPKRVLKKISKKKILVIDHHPPTKYSNVTYVNPRLHEKGAYIPVSYLCYKIYRKIFSPDNENWIAAIGTLGDHGVTSCTDLFEELKLKKKKLIGVKKISDENLYRKSLLGKITKIINAAQVVKGKEGASHAVKILIHSKNYSDVLRDKKLFSWGKKFDGEFGRISKDFRERKILKKNFVIYEVKSKFNLHSSISGYLSQFYPEKILVIYQKNRMCKVSFRRGKNVNVHLGDLAKKLVSGIPNSSGGGHPAASGASFPRKYTEKFLKRFL